MHKEKNDIINYVYKNMETVSDIIKNYYYKSNLLK